jgi:hypothetical protein
MQDLGAVWLYLNILVAGAFAGLGAAHERCSAQRPHKSLAGQPNILPPVTLF